MDTCTPLARSGRAGAGLLGRALAAAVLALGVSGASAGTWQDAVGRTVTVPDAPRRVVSLAPNVTEILFALGAGDRVVGVTGYCDYPAEARLKRRVGSYAEPSVEAIVALAPDLVVASADSTPPSLVGALEAAGLAVYTVYPRTLAETLETLRAVGALLGAPEAGEALAQDLAGTLERLRAAVTALGTPRPPAVLCCVMLRPLVVAGPRTVVHDLIEAAGGRNVVADGPSRYPTWGMEPVLAADPDVIVVSPHPGEPDSSAVFGPWGALRAVASGRVATIDADWLHRPGPRLVLGLRALAEALHGPAVAGALRP